MDRIFEIISATTYTKDQWYHRLELAREFAEREVYTAADKTESLLDRLTVFLNEHSVGSETCKAMVGWGEDVWQDLCSSSFSQDIDMLYTRFHTTPSVTLYVAIFPETKYLAKLAADIRSWYEPHTVLDIHVRPEVLAGCGISVGSTYYDYTLRSQLSRARKDLHSLVSEYVSDRFA